MEKKNFSFTNKLREIFTFIFVLQSIFLSSQNARGFADTIGFAHKAKQMDSVIARIGRLQIEEISRYGRNEMPWKAVIAPHDDYTYTGYLYPLALRQVKAKTIILIGVAHKAKRFNLENTMVFENFSFWNAPYGKVEVSDLRGEIISALPKNSFVVHDSCHIVEHSLEAEIPFLQYYNKGFEIIPILIPYMNYDTMAVLSKKLAAAISKVMIKHKLAFGKGLAIVISNDAVHYGDQEWGGKNFARFGKDSAGYKNAVGFEQEIIDNCIAGDLKTERIKKFTEYTVQKENFKEYNWTWCGRYSVPFGMLTTYYLNATFSVNSIKGYYLHYSTSLLNKHIPVSDLGMGVTAVCNLHHWVGYLAAGFR